MPDLVVERALEQLARGLVDHAKNQSRERRPDAV
jgi:hypothetical protein